MTIERTPHEQDGQYYALGLRPLPPVGFQAFRYWDSGWVLVNAVSAKEATHITNLVNGTKRRRFQVWSEDLRRYVNCG